MVGMNKVSMALYNRIVVMKLLYRYDKLSIKEIAQKMMLTISAVSKIVRKLHRENFISLSSEFVHCTGNHQGLWCINKDLNLFLCIYISSAGINSVVVDSVGNALESIKSDRVEGASVLDILLSHCSHWQGLFSGLKYAALSINEEMAHELTRQKGGIVGALEQQTGLKIRAENACYTMSLAERWLNNEQSSCLIFISAGYTLEAVCVLVDSPYGAGRVIPIKLGQMFLSDPMEGAIRTLESHIGEKSLCAKGGNTNIEEFYKALAEGKARETRAYAEARRQLGMGLGNLINLFLPDKIIVSGSFLQGNVNLQEDIIGSPPYFDKHLVTKTRLRTEQLMAGGAFLWIEEFLEKNNLL